jgi:hypothetical protein
MLEIYTLLLRKGQLDNWRLHEFFPQGGRNINNTSPKLLYWNIQGSLIFKVTYQFLYGL